MEMLFCPYCGSRLQTDAIFCSSCGKKMPLEQETKTMSSAHDDSSTTTSPMVHYHTTETLEVPPRQKTLGNKLQSIMTLFCTIDGRLNRKPFILGLLAVYTAIFFIAILLGAFTTMSEDEISKVGYLLSIIPAMVLCIKRSHDTNRSGWFGVLAFIPIACLYSYFVLFFTRGTDGPNDYGNDPLTD